MNDSYLVKSFTLAGLQDMQNARSLYFTLTLLVYLLIISINVTLILTIILDKGLHEPMYMFVCSLCANSLYGTAGFYPKMLCDLLSEEHVISYAWCLIQMYVIYSSLLCEIPILTSMAYDRYVAICRPLQYHTVMTSRRVIKLLLACSFPLFYAFGSTLLTLRLPLCGSHIPKLYCDNWSVVKFSCVPTTINDVVGYVITLLEVVQVLLTIFSYCLIVRVCLRSSDGRHKFTQTCVPHLLTIGNFITATVFDFLYSRYGSSLQLGVRNFLSVEFLVIPPLFNPIVYGLKLHKVRSRLLRLCSRGKVVQNHSKREEKLKC